MGHSYLIILISIFELVDAEWKNFQGMKLLIPWSSFSSSDKGQRLSLTNICELVKFMKDSVLNGSYLGVIFSFGFCWLRLLVYLQSLQHNDSTDKPSARKTDC